MLRFWGYKNAFPKGPARQGAGLQGRGLNEILMELLHHQGVGKIGFGFG